MAGYTDNQREDEDYDCNAEVDQFDGRDLTDWCGMQADASCTDCMTFGGCTCDPVIYDGIADIVDCADDVPF